MNKKAKREQESKELELEQRNAELAEAKERHQEIAKEIDQKDQELQQ